MSDIFDEADDILNDIDSDISDHEIPESGGDSNFNESELQDIMAEIEGFEEESEENNKTAAKPEVIVHTRSKNNAQKSNVVAINAVDQVKKPNLQNEIDAELEMSLGEIKKEKTIIAQIEKTAPHLKTTASSEISFEAHGQMSLNLGFKIGDHEAQLVIDPVKGLTVSLSGVELCLNLEEGCKVTMLNGVKFTIPLTSPETSLKKKSA